MKDKITQQLCKLPILRESNNPVPKRLEVSGDYIQMQKRNNSVLDNYKSQYSITRDKVFQSQIEKNLSIERLKTILDKNFDRTVPINQSSLSCSDDFIPKIYQYIPETFRKKQSDID